MQMLRKQLNVNSTSFHWAPGVGRKQMKDGFAEAERRREVKITFGFN